MTVMHCACNTMSFNCSTAAGFSSARITNRMDTAINVAVSIIVPIIPVLMGDFTM